MRKPSRTKIRKAVTYSSGAFNRRAFIDVLYTTITDQPGYSAGCPPPIPLCDLAAPPKAYALQETVEQRMREYQTCR